MSNIFSKEEVDEFRKGLKSCKVADSLHEGMILYLEKHILPGRYLTACLENNLVDALKYASTEKCNSIYPVMTFLYNYVPIYAWGSAWGSKEIVANWVKARQMFST